MPRTGERIIREMDRMEREKIAAQCALFACRVCRTKTGWPHQVWCDAADALRPLNSEIERPHLRLIDLKTNRLIQCI